MGTKLFNILSTIIAYLTTTDRRTLLWTNATPTVGFPTQTLTFSERYDAYEIHFSTYVGRDEDKITQMEVLEGETTALHGHVGSGGEVSGTLWTGRRTVWRSPTDEKSIVFGDPYSVFGTGNWSQYTSNMACVPMKIYGIKYGAGVLTT